MKRLGHVEMGDARLSFGVGVARVYALKSTARLAFCAYAYTSTPVSTRSLPVMTRLTAATATVGPATCTTMH